MMMRPRPAPAARPPEANRRARRSGARSSVRALTLVRREHETWGQVRVHDTSMESIGEMLRCRSASMRVYGCRSQAGRDSLTMVPWQLSDNKGCYARTDLGAQGHGAYGRAGGVQPLAALAQLPQVRVLDTRHS